MSTTSSFPVTSNSAILCLLVSENRNEVRADAYQDALVHPKWMWVAKHAVHQPAAESTVSCSVYDPSVHPMVCFIVQNETVHYCNFQ